LSPGRIAWLVDPSLAHRCVRKRKCQEGEEEKKGNREGGEKIEAGHRSASLDNFFSTFKSAGNALDRHGEAKLKKERRRKDRRKEKRERKGGRREKGAGSASILPPQSVGRDPLSSLY